MDFNFKSYQSLLTALQSRGFSFITVSEYAEATSPPSLRCGGQASSPFILLRHDVEAKYENALQMARIQHSRGIRGTYYFRIFGNNGNAAIIREIVALGHEIGYHYDDLSYCKGDYEKAIRRFEENLTYLRQFAPVTSATMEGAPLSRYDNRDLWAQREPTPAPGRLSVAEGRPPNQEPGTQNPEPGTPNQEPGTRNPEPRPASLVPRPVFHYKDFGILICEIRG